ncbi:MAG TPA: tetratricopeptide repeat protein [Rhizomicrobium sp.]
MADIFREVEEEVRRERIEKLWKKYGDHVIALGALIVIGAAGLQLYRVYEHREALKASATFAASAQILERGQPAAAAAEFVNIAKNAPGGYAKVGQLAEADALFAAGRHGDAIRIYKQIVQSGDAYLSPVARLRAAWAIADGATRADVETLVAPLTDPTNPWHAMAREILAYEDLRWGNTADALKAYQSIAAESDTPSSLRTRAAAMARFLKAGGDANYGSLPKPEPAPKISSSPSGGPPGK